jgi:hypothetical protein
MGFELFCGTNSGLSNFVAVKTAGILISGGGGGFKNAGERTGNMITKRGKNFLWKTMV